MTVSAAAFESFAGLAGRYWRVVRGSWRARDELAARDRTPLEREFLPAALEILETPAPVLPRAVVWVIVAALAFAILWSWFGRVDMVAVAPGKVIAADKTKVIQPAETAVVKRILVTDGQQVRAGEVLVELEAAATATAAETARIREGLMAARLESARFEALARAASGNREPVLAVPVGAAKQLADSESRAMESQYQEQRARLAALDAEIAKRVAELGSAKELVAKLAETLPIAQRRAEDYRNLVEQKFVSQHGYLEREQERIEQERDLAFQEAKARELTAAIEEAKRRRDSALAEFERSVTDAKVAADKRAALLEQEFIKARTRERQQTLIAPVDGTVQQLAVHTVGGVVAPAQALMVIAPSDYQPEIEAVLENKDVGFVKVGQRVEVKVETFPFTRYGTLPGTVSLVSSDAIPDEKRGPVFQTRVRLERITLRVDGRDVVLTPGMAVSAEIATGKRSVLEFFLDPIRRTINEGIRER